LAEHRNKRNRAKLPPLTLAQIKDWATKHFQATGRWPRRSDVEVTAAPGETWNGIRIAMRRGGRGLPGGSSLPQLFSSLTRG
jgi:hypothetical protein